MTAWRRKDNQEDQNQDLGETFYGIEVVTSQLSMAQLFCEQYELFMQKFGRPPEGSDPVFFKPNEDEPVVMSTNELLEWLRGKGIEARINHKRGHL